MSDAKARGDARGEFIASLDTEVPVSRSAQQIQALVERFGALEFTTLYDPQTSRRTGVRFKIKDPHIAGVAVPVELRAPSDIIAHKLFNSRSRWGMDRATEQAERVAWRNLHDFVRASLIGVQTGIMSLGEAFMASLIITDGAGNTRRLGDVANEKQLLRPTSDGRLLLGSGE